MLRARCGALLGKAQQKCCLRFKIFLYKIVGAWRPYVNPLGHSLQTGNSLVTLWPSTVGRDYRRTTAGKRTMAGEAKRTMAGKGAVGRKETKAGQKKEAWERQTGGGGGSGV